MPFDTDARDRAPEAGIALALSGGGFRAVLFHVGVLWRLNELGILGRLARISSVSGGSIAAGLLALRWRRLTFDDHGEGKGSGQGNDKGDAIGIATNFTDEVVAPLRRFCATTVDVGSVIAGALNPFKSAGDEVADRFRRDLGMGASLQTLPDTPRFVFNSTNYATGVSFRFSKPYAGDYRIGLIRNPGFDVATAVACSSAFPPLLAPIALDVDPDAFERMPGADLWDQPDFRRRLQLADGGVYDNLGLETVWGRYDTVLASDAGKPFELDAGIFSLAPKQLFRVMHIGLNQALALRKRMLIDHYRHGGLKGAFWAIDTPIVQGAGVAGTPLGAIGTASGALPVPAAKTAELAALRTRLDRFSETEQCELINWGYAASDSAVRAWAPQIAVRPSLPAWPYPDHALG